MKRSALICVLALLSGCASYSYPVKDGGDGVYYAESPPVYTYVNGYFGFPYYGPFAGYWYNPTWYSPIQGPHYSWYRPYSHCLRPYAYCGEPHYRPSHAFARSNAAGRRNNGKANSPVASKPVIEPLMPVGFEQMVISSGHTKYSRKNPTFSTAGSKSRYAVKSGKSTVSYKRSSASAYRPASSNRNSSSGRYPSTPSRSRSVRQTSNRTVIREEQ